MGSRCGVYLFAIQAERVGVLEQRLEQFDGLGAAAGVG